MTLHTDIPSRSEVERLLSTREPCCVSIYLTTSPITQEAQGDRIELKNLAAAAAEQLEAAGADRRDVTEVRESLDDLVADDDFWAEQARSLAVFAVPSGVRTFRLPNRLTRVVEVADRFYVKPLLRAITFPQAAFVLALAGGGVRLVEVTPEGPRTPSTSPACPPTSRARRGRPRSPTGRRWRGCRARRGRRSGCASSRARSTRRCAAC